MSDDDREAVLNAIAATRMAARELHEHGFESYAFTLSGVIEELEDLVRDSRR